MDFKALFTLQDGGIKVVDIEKFRGLMDELVYDAVFTADEEQKKAKLIVIKEACKQAGAYPASIQELYEEMGRNYPGFTVPAMNIRGLTYDSCKAVFRRALKMKVGAMIFEIARSEIGYTAQRPLEYCTMVLAAAVAEGYAGPVFIQGDHYQLIKKYFASDPAAETGYVKGLIAESIEAEFYNIDIDTSTLVDLSLDSLSAQQAPNYENAALLSEHIRSLEPEGITVSIGGEIGEIGKKNSTPEELRAYLDGYKSKYKGSVGLSKLSVQSGTSHGGVVLPDGTLAQVKIDFETLRTLSEVARADYGLSGAVQHGASTLPNEAFDKFPETGTSEVHLATGFQNIIYDSAALPDAFRQEAYDFIRSKFGSEKKDDQTDEQFIYKTRKKGFGSLKQKWWDLPPDVRAPIMQELEDQFGLLFTKLKVGDTVEIVNRTVTNKPIAKALTEAAKALLS